MILRMAFALSIFLNGVTAAQSADAFKRLGGSDLKRTIVGKVVTDTSHWSDQFEPNGTLRGMELGHVKLGTWKIVGDDMCVVRKARKPSEECFEIWMSKDQVEYRRDGFTVTSGILHKQ
jgi:hypothetical protein